MGEAAAKKRAREREELLGQIAPSDRRYAIPISGARAGMKLGFGELEIGDVVDLFEPDGEHVSDGGSWRVRIVSKPEILPTGAWGFESEDASAELPVVKEPLPEHRQVNLPELEHGLRVAALAGPARALELHRRVPELFRRRGWPRHDHLNAVAIAALSCCKVGAVHTMIKIPTEGRDHERWKSLGLRASAARIVGVLDLGRLLEP